MITSCSPRVRTFAQSASSDGLCHGIRRPPGLCPCPLLQRTSHSLALARVCSKASMSCSHPLRSRVGVLVVVASHGPRRARWRCVWGRAFGVPSSRRRPRLFSSRSRRGLAPHRPSAMLWSLLSQLWCCPGSEASACVDGDRAEAPGGRLPPRRARPPLAARSVPWPPPRSSRPTGCKGHCLMDVRWLKFGQPGSTTNPEVL